MNSRKATSKVEVYRVADVGVDVVLDIFEYFVEVSGASSTQEACVAISLRSTHTQTHEDGYDSAGCCSCRCHHVIIWHHHTHTSYAVRVSSQSRDAMPASSRVHQLQQATTTTTT